jgi:uncharacterized membrane protein YqjE
MIEEAHQKPPEERSVGELVSDLTDELKRLIRDELQLAVFELQRKGKRMGLGAGLLGAAGILALFGAGALIAAVILALALVMSAWLAAVVTGAGLLIAAGLAALAGRKEVERAAPPVPEEAMKGVRKDVDTVKQGVHS